MNEKKDEVEAIIASYLPKEEGLQKTVLQAMNYSFLAGGKRLRPILMLETYRMLGGTSKIIEPFMAAIEMIHTYSLIHDDLPAMDNDELRRGRPTTHIAFTEAMAILAGDGLLNLSFESALSAFQIEPKNPNIIKALQLLFHHSGIYGMIGGQVADVEWESKVPDLEVLEFIYNLKTGALLEAAMVTGAVLANADQSQIELVSGAAKKIGMAYQIEDDILDIAGDQTLIGKPVGSDRRNHKITYASLLGIEKAGREAERLSKEALQDLDPLLQRNPYLKELLTGLINRKK